MINGWSKIFIKTFFRKVIKGLYAKLCWWHLVIFDVLSRSKYQLTNKGLDSKTRSSKLTKDPWIVSEDYLLECKKSRLAMFHFA